MLQLDQLPVELVHLDHPVVAAIGVDQMRRRIDVAGMGLADARLDEGHVRWHQRRKSRAWCHLQREFDAGIDVTRALAGIGVDHRREMGRRDARTGIVRGVGVDGALSRPL